MQETRIPEKAVLYTVGAAMLSPLRVNRGQIPSTVKEAIRPLMAPDPRGYFLQWAFAWGAALAAIVAAARLHNVWSSIAVVFFVATRQNLLALLMHEQTHWLCSRSKWADYFCELFVAYPLMVTLEGYRRVHLSHHAHYFTDSDPDYIRKQGKEWTFPQQMRYFIALLFRDLSGLSEWKTLKGKTLDESSAPVKANFNPPRWLRPAFLLSLVTALTMTHMWAVYLLYWLLPLLTVMQGFIRWGAITEHKYNLINPTVEESTPLIELRWWEKILFPNLHFTLHIYHHWFPTVPASKLPAVHRIFRESGLVEDQHVFFGYFQYARYLMRPERVPRSAASAA